MTRKKGMEIYIETKLSQFIGLLALGIIIGMLVGLFWGISSTRSDIGISFCSAQNMTFKEIIYESGMFVGIVCEVGENEKECIEKVWNKWMCKGCPCYYGYCPDEYFNEVQSCFFQSKIEHIFPEAYKPHGVWANDTFKDKYYEMNLSDIPKEAKIESAEVSLRSRCCYPSTCPQAKNNREPCTCTYTVDCMPAEAIQ